MQQVNINRISSYTKDQNCIFLVNKDFSFLDLQLSDNEITYIKKEFGNKNYQVCINRFTNWLIIQSFDASKTTDQIKENLRKAGHPVCHHLQKQKATSVVVVDQVSDPSYGLALAEGISLSNYQFIKYLKSASEKETSLTNISIVSNTISDKEVAALVVTTEAVYSARDLVNEPVSVLTSVKLAEEIQKLGELAGYKVEIFHKQKIEELKMGGLLAVNQGSTAPPTFAVMEWKPANAKNVKPIVLVGKGVVYDTGGLSLKPTPDSMDYMKCDMAGGATAAAVLYAIAKMKLPLHVVGLVPSTDNRLGPDSYAPGDIITISDGTTVEVLNTDAEGRLILADALCYAKQYSPEMVIDLATLTGAAHRAIGTQGAVGMGNIADELVAKLVASGLSVHERIAVFPFWEEYGEMIKSEVADLKNIGGELAGAITAGKFLEYFTDYPYFHLDIAGTAFLKKGDSYRGTGATGFGVRLLVDFLNNYSAK